MSKTEDVRKAVVEDYQDWDPRLVELVRHGEEPVDCSLFMLPVGWEWSHHSGVTLIGDSAHVMTPFAGEGVNLGIQDALMLSRAILASSTPDPTSVLSVEIKKFERDMFVRAKKTAE